MTIYDVVIKAIEEFNDSIREDLARKGIDTTRTASNSLHVEQKGDVLYSVGIDYLEYLNRGRPPGKFPPMTAITRWVNLKGIDVHPYVIARAIALNGSRIYQDRTKGIELEEKTRVLEDMLNDILPNFIANQITLSLNKALKG